MIHANNASIKDYEGVIESLFKSIRHISQTKGISIQANWVQTLHCFVKGRCV